MNKKNKQKFAVAIVSVISLSAMLAFSDCFTTDASVSVDKEAEANMPVPPKSTRSSEEEAPGSTEVVDTSGLSDDEDYYEVASGQTLWEISQDTGMSVQDLMDKNGLSNSLVFEGQYLIVDE